MRSRQEIIERAAPVFNVNGYAGTSMQMVMDATGYQKGGSYRHFDSKNALAQAAFDYNFEQLKASYLLELHAGSNAPERLMKLLTNFLHFVANPKLKGGCPILNMAPEVDDTMPDLRNQVSKALEEITGIVENIIEVGQKEGSFRSELEAKSEANFIISLVEGSIMMAKLQRDRHLIPDNCLRLQQYIQQFIFHPAHSTQKPQML